MCEARRAITDEAIGTYRQRNKVDQITEKTAYNNRSSAAADGSVNVSETAFEKASEECELVECVM